MAWAGLAILFVIIFSVSRLREAPRNALFHGQPESHWIEHLVYRDEAELKQWQEFGPDGIGVLIRGFENANRPRERIHRQIYSAVGRVAHGELLRLVPAPKDDLTRGTRMAVVDLLSRLGSVALPAAPTMARALRDEDVGVRMLAINYFTQGENQSALINQLDAKARRAMLPDFIAAMQDPKLRYNAVGVLGYYPDHAKVVSPILLKALHDPAAYIRVVAAKSLFMVAPNQMEPVGAVPLLIDLLKDPEGANARWAAQLLGEMRLEPSLTVPALLECMAGTNRMSSAAAARALVNFPDQAGIIVPVLLKAYQETNSPTHRTIGATLKKLDPAAAADAGVK